MKEEYTRFQDIPQFTRDGNYTVNSEPEYMIENLLTDWVPNMGLQLNPDFQRAHVWTEEQQIAYIEYFLRGGKSGRELYFNHPGWMGSFRGDFVLVDGKQRIEAFRRFFNNEIKVFGHYHEEFGDKIRTVSHTFIVHINDLKTREEVLTWYIEMNSGGTVHTKDEIEKVRALLRVEKDEDTEEDRRNLAELEELGLM